MMVCPNCERLFRNGDQVRAQVLGEYEKRDEDGHYVHGYAEEWVEHISCSRERWEERAVKYLRRKWRWLRESIFRAKWAA